MRAICPTARDEALHRALKEWRTGTPLPPHFHEQVWHRIALMGSTNRKVKA